MANVERQVTEDAVVRIKCKGEILSADTNNVLDFLKKLQKDQKGVNKSTLTNLNTIVSQTIGYLENTPCAQQSPEAVREFLVAMKQFELTKAEKLQILNNSPTTLVELQLMIEENEERFTEEQMHDILAVVAQTLPGKCDVDLTSDVAMESDVENRQ